MQQQEEDLTSVARAAVTVTANAQTAVVGSTSDVSLLNFLMTCDDLGVSLLLGSSEARTDMSSATYVCELHNFGQLCTALQATFRTNMIVMSLQRVLKNSG